ETVEQLALLDLEKTGGTVGEFGQQRLLPGCLGTGQNGIRAGQQIGDFHNVTNGLASANFGPPCEGCAPIGASPGGVKPWFAGTPPSAVPPSQSAEPLIAWAEAAACATT